MKWPGEPQRPGGTTFEANMGGDLVGLDQGNIFDQQAHHSFPFPVGCSRIAPQRREVGGQRQDLRSALFIESRPVSFALLFVPFLSLGQGPQLVVPIRLQCVGNEPIVRIHLHVSSLGEVRLVPGALNLLVAQLIRLVQTRRRWPGRSPFPGCVDRAAGPA